MVATTEIRASSRRARRVALGAIAAVALVVVGVAPTPAASTTTVMASMEAWYLGPGTVPEQAPQEGLSGMPAANPYRAGTLHVGVAGGTENARTVLRLDASSLGDAGLAAATLVLPVDPGDGTLAADTATIDVCLVSDPGDAVDGSLSTPPPADCSASAPAHYEDTPTPRFVVDLEPLALEPAVRTGGLAILPSAAARARNATWHVALFTRATAPTPADAIHAEVTLVDDTLAGEGLVDGDSAAVVRGAPPAVDDVVLGDAFDGPSIVSDIPAGALVPAESASPPAPLLAQPSANAVPIAAAVDGGFAYSSVLLLPFALLAGLAITASALARDPRVVRIDNEQAVGSRQAPKAGRR
jgi:hypothetical protein